MEYQGQLCMTDIREVCLSYRVVLGTPCSRAARLILDTATLIALSAILFQILYIYIFNQPNCSAK